MNLSRVTDECTARTDPECASQRASNMASLLTTGGATVLELCAGPSLETLEGSYRNVGIECVGNDVDERWVDYYPEGDWIVGDALAVPWNCEGLVFAPPLSRGCTGKRDDSLMIGQVNPSYFVFLDQLNRRLDDLPRLEVACIVLPARAIATSRDREQFYRVLNIASDLGVTHVAELSAGRRKVRKYVDIYIEL